MKNTFSLTEVSLFLAGNYSLIKYFHNLKFEIMKTKFFVTVAAMFFFTGTLFAQFTIGIKGGANMGKITGESFKDEFKLGYQIGGFVTIPLGSTFAIQPEVLFNQTNVDTSTKFSDIYSFNQIKDIQLKQLLIPIMLNINLNKFLALQLGPQFGVAINQDKSLLQNGSDAFKSGMFSGAAGLQLRVSKLRVYGRFTGGMTNLDNVGDKENWKVQNIQLGIGLAL